MVSSILTNNGAMTALQSLKATQKNLLDTQNRISTGLKVGTAKDNAATWAVATSMRGDIANFKQVSENLSVSAGVVKTASTGTEQIASLISKIREQVTSVQDGVKDAETVQATIDEYVNQIRNIVGSASYKGVNLINNSRNGNEKILASVNTEGSVSTPTYINVTAQNLTMDADGLLAGLSSLSVVEQKQKFAYSEPTLSGSFGAGDQLKFTFELNGVSKTAIWTAPGSKTAAEGLEGLKDAINKVAGDGNGKLAAIDASGRLVVDASLATSNVTFDGKNALSKAGDIDGNISLGSAVDLNPPAPKFSYSAPANGSVAVDEVYSFHFKLNGENQVASYTVQNGDDWSDVLDNLKTEINRVAGTGNEVASIDADGKLVVDAGLAADTLTFDGAKALSKKGTDALNVTPAAKEIIREKLAGTLTANTDGYKFDYSLDGTAATTISVEWNGAESLEDLAGRLVQAINAALGDDVATYDPANDDITINAAKSHKGNVTGLTLTELGGMTAPAAPTTALLGTENDYNQTFDISTVSSDGLTANDELSFEFTLDGVSKKATVKVEDGQTEREVLSALAAAINEEAGSVIASVQGPAGATTGLLSVQAALSTSGAVTFTAGTALTFADQGTAGTSAVDKSPKPVTDYASLLATLKTAEDAVLSAGAAFGAAQTRIELQKDFMDKLVDTLTSGVGALVDADMSEEAARLQALQVQEQLGTQALSIANQAPQSILSLFRG